MVRDKYSFWNLILPVLLAVSLFFFRTVLGAALVFAIISTILLSSAPAMKKNGKRIALIGWGVLALAVFGGGTIATEIEGVWEDREDNVADKRLQQTLRGNQWAKYATGTVMAPMVFVLLLWMFLAERARRQDKMLVERTRESLNLSKHSDISEK